ncbi:hypothetical protein GCM10010400_17080 [Streptomyces aculeolatus]|uniref:serine/threonine-protein kinase n=1 Tax=Streptomyces aculeolatus TaxID=270689 RepID=UPI001CEC2D8D|nr:serine/threonine-protein kinase [Streptomyces aculeolatus]
MTAEGEAAGASAAGGGSGTGAAAGGGEYRGGAHDGSEHGGADIRPLEEDDPAALGSYTLLGRLASGGMGRIFLARSVRDGSLAAVKTLLAEGEVDPTDRRRFAREVKVARRAEGVRTARVLDADPDAPRPWMATEYVPAPSVAELVRRAGPLAGTAARWVTRGALESLAELHRQGIVHRDVKPQNLLLELAGPRLIDFGISHAADLTRTQLTLGTVAFTSPEQAAGEPSTAASDVYRAGGAPDGAGRGRLAAGAVGRADRRVRAAGAGTGGGPAGAAGGRGRFREHGGARAGLARAGGRGSGCDGGCHPTAAEDGTGGAGHGAGASRRRTGPGPAGGTGFRGSRAAAERGCPRSRSGKGRE